MSQMPRVREDWEPVIERQIRNGMPVEVLVKPALNSKVRFEHFKKRLLENMGETKANEYLGYSLDEIDSLLYEEKLVSSMLFYPFYLQRKSFLFHGDTGTRKTTLAIALGKKACAEGHSVHFIKWGKLLDDRQQVLDGVIPHYSVFDPLYSCRLLILDELSNRENATDSQRELLQQIIDRRAGKSTMVTTNLSLERLTALYRPETVDRMTNKDEWVIKSFTMLQDGKFRNGNIGRQEHYV